MLREKEIVPGKDVFVFAFDNGPLAVNLNPPYEKFGFRVRPNEDAGPAMDQWFVADS